MGKTKRRRGRKQNRRSRKLSRRSIKKSSRRKRQAGNILIRDFFDEKTPVAQNNYLRRALSNEIGDIQYQLESRYFQDDWKDIDKFVRKLSHYKVISYPLKHEPLRPTFIDQIYKNRIELLENIEDIEFNYNKYKALKRFTKKGTNHHGHSGIKKLLEKQPSYSVRKNWSIEKQLADKRRLTDIVQIMEKNVLKLTGLIKFVIEIETEKRNRQ